MVEGWSVASLIEEVFIAPRKALVPLPDTQIIERPGWFQVYTPSLRHGGLNEIAVSAIEGDVDALLDRAVEQYRGMKVRWTLLPEHRPTDLAERITRRGFTRHEVHAMVRTTDIDAAAERDVTVERVDATTVDDFTRTMAEGWGMDPGPLARLNRMVIDHPRGPHLFLARAGGEPAATAGVVLLPKSAYLIGGVVVPRFRGRGLYRALVAARLRHAAEAGLAIATTQARADTSAPILERLGFETVCTVPSFIG
jgi:GNAT superfamily N-acetyltransferase